MLFFFLVQSCWGSAERKEVFLLGAGSLAVFSPHAALDSTGPVVLLKGSDAA